MIASIAMFGGGAAWLCYLAATTRHGVVIEEVIHLNAHQARIFYGVLAVLSFGLTALGVRTTARLASGKLHIAIDDDGITVPTRRTGLVPRRFTWAGIISARLHKVSGQVFMTLTDAAGKGGIARSYLSNAEFDEIVGIVAEHVPPPRAELPIARARVDR